ncbi:MAG: PQQ-binding-like beta-propeller repeat protein [Aureliella sp.]
MAIHLAGLRSKLTTCAMLTYMLVLATTATAQNVGSNEAWPWWRGPERNGWAAPSANPPVKFGKSSDGGMVWKAPIAGRGHSSPIVVGNQVFMATADEKSQTQFIVCLDSSIGKQLWQTEISSGGFPAQNHPKNTEASSTLACDGESLLATFFHHKQVELVSLSLDGSVTWRKKVCDFNPKKYEYGYAPSPTIYKSLVIVSAEYDGPSYLVAYDRRRGREVWRTPRKATISFSTPIVANVAGRDQLLISGANTVSSYNPANGNLLWQTPGTTSATCGTMVWQDDIVVASGGYPKKETIAIRADGSRQALWRNDAKCYEQSMIVVDGFVYGLTDRGVLYCWQLKTGKEMWRQRLGGSVSASPVYAGGHIYWANETGTMFVFKPSPSRYEAVAENRIGDSAFASPAVVGNRIFLRVGERAAGGLQEYVYCFER